MKNFIIFLLFPLFGWSQTISQKLDNSIKKLLNSPGGSAASVSCFISDNQGKLIYEFQGTKGLTTASTQKIFTAAAALSLLGKDYTYTTKTYISGKIIENHLLGDIIVESNGDPTLGSWRYEDYTPEIFIKKFTQAILFKGIKKIKGNLIIDDSFFDFQKNPGGWPWNDLGNYYGAGVWGVNWRENQFDAYFENGKISGFNIPLDYIKWINETKVAGSTDQSIIYTSPFSNFALINGVLPSKKISVSGALPNPPLQLAFELKNALQQAGILLEGEVKTTSLEKINGNSVDFIRKETEILSYSSPKLDKIIYWFMKKSVNLYGETLIKTIAKEKKGVSDFKTGIAILKEFWKEKGIEAHLINFADGSGLSPQNYVAAKALVQALVWAKNQIWFRTFLDAFPYINDMQMKSGTLQNTKSFAGYHTSKNGKNYVFSIIINNFQGNNISEELFKILNFLK